MKKLLIEASVLEQDKLSGVNYLTDGLATELEKLRSDDFSIGYFWLNFLGRKQPHNHNVMASKKRGTLRQIRLFPQRIYAKLVYAKVAPPLGVGKVDWLLFPNFYIWPTLRQVKKSVIIHDLCFMRYPEYVEDKNQAFLDRVATRSIKKADLIISNSEFTTSEIVALTGTPKDRIVTLSVPVDGEAFDKKYNKGPARLRARYNITKPYILSLGTLEPRKNLMTLVNAYCQLPARQRNKYSLVLAGRWGWKVEELRELIEIKQAEGFDIIATDYIDHDDRTTFYRSASYYAITTHYEGFGMPLLEALHCGLPTVAVDIPVMREVGGDACLWASKDTNDIAQKLTQLIDDPKLATKLSKLGPGQSAQFSWQKTARKLYDRLQEE